MKENAKLKGSEFICTVSEIHPFSFYPFTSLFYWIFLALDIYIYKNLTYFLKYKQRGKNEKESKECLFRSVSMNFICMRYEYLSNTLFTCQEPDLNWWHEDFQSSALPTELSRPFSVHNPSKVLVSMSMKRTKKKVLTNLI